MGSTRSSNWSVVMESRARAEQGKGQRRLLMHHNLNSSNSIGTNKSCAQSEGKAAGRRTGLASCTLSTHFPSAANSHCDPSCITDGLGSAFVRAMYVSEP